MTDRELLDQLREGNQDAFNQIFRTYYAALVSVAESMLNGRGVAEEITQDVMLELWRRRESLAIQETLRAYLFRAVRNRALNHARHERIQRKSEPYLTEQRATAPTAIPQLVEEEIETALRNAVDALPNRCREVFELSRVHGLKYSEIASTLGISVKGVEAQMGKALRELRKRLAPWLPRPDDV